MADPAQEDLVEITAAPIYDQSPSSGESSVTVRARKNIPAGLTILREMPVAYVPIYTFTPPPVDTVHPDVMTTAAEKEDYFKAGWPTLLSYLYPFENRFYLQLVCLLIVRNPRLAEAYVPTSDSNALLPPFMPALTFPQFRACMTALCMLNISLDLARKWSTFETFSRLYTVVCANSIPCSTLVTDQRFALGLYPVSARINHACDPNCVRVGTPEGMYTVALRPLKKGDEITVSYVQSFVPGVVDPQFLRDQLMQRWGFQCRCEKCRGDLLRTGGDAGTGGTEDTVGRMAQLIVDHPGLDELLKQLGQVTTAGDYQGIVETTAVIRRDFSDLVESEPCLAYVVSRRYMSLLQPCDTDPMTLARGSFEYWANLYRRVLSDPDDTLYAVWGQFHVTLFKLFTITAAIQAAEKTPESEAHISRLMDEVVEEMVTLRKLARRVLGSHYFLWTEFCMYNGMDVFLTALEPKFLHREHGPVPKTVTTGPESAGGGREYLHSVDVFKRIQQRLVDAVN